MSNISSGSVRFSGSVPKTVISSRAVVGLAAVDIQKAPWTSMISHSDSHSVPSILLSSEVPIEVERGSLLLEVKSVLASSGFIISVS